MREASVDSGILTIRVTTGDVTYGMECQFSKTNIKQYKNTSLTSAITPDTQFCNHSFKNSTNLKK